MHPGWRDGHNVVVNSGTSSTFGDFDFGLTKAEETRARELYDEAIVVDMMYYGPCG